MEEKKPDYVVYDEETGRYNASLLPYASSVSAPKIVATDLTSWKQNQVTKVNDSLSAEFDELKKKYQDMLRRLEINEMIYQARFSFQPQLGKTYHLYLDDKGSHFLSVIAPDECNWEHEGSYRLGADNIWTAHPE